MQPLEDLLPRDFGGERAQRRVGNLIFGIKPGSGRHARRQMRSEQWDAMALESRDHDGLGKGKLLVEQIASASRRGGSIVSILFNTKTLGAANLRQAREDGIDFGIHALA